eukprot:CAMPEP_0175336310 /NCGR_PEP_ID=MMETSP0095-20121207/3746_1 /TAXON_ID=311494 /ORGANISM="Alexandrium monilatum, Strain CCMP3105" /LENGTH=578 /DNA_ID=CAMNT_0016633663 /DNA_START=1 /DNA_END=1737 /DNA_ORIENTATION=+
MGNECCKPDIERVLDSSQEAADTHAKLLALLEAKPYLERKVHPLHRRVELCQQHLVKAEVAAAADQLTCIDTALKADDKGLRAAFDKFDLDRSGSLEVEEFKHFVTYVGFGENTVPDVLREHDRDADGRITIQEFDDFVGRMGGISALFERRREAAARATDRGAAYIPLGARVRAYRYEKNAKSDSVWDGRVVEVCASGDTLKIQFNVFKRPAEKGSPGDAAEQDDVQEVPREWIAEDLDLVQSLSQIGILDDAQHYWTILLPASEQYVVKDLVQIQREAIFGVRRQATVSHNQAVLNLLQRGSSIGVGSTELWSVLTWVRDLAPVIVHVDLDAVCEFLEQDTHYRNQFETSTSKGLLCPQKREEWERKLFGGVYDEAAPFERPKYGVLDVMNDNRGVLCARDYGDSYFMLKNARLRCTFSPVDSGGICGDRLAVLDQYAHVLMEFSDDELREVCRVATAKEGSQDRIGDSTKLDGFNYKEAQIHGELDLAKHVKRLVVHPRHLVDGVDEGRIRKLCAKHGWEFIWMHDERKRRIYEERQSQDHAMLEMSWASQETVSLPPSFMQANAGKTAKSNSVL